MNEAELFLTPCSKQQGDSRAYQHLQETVLNPVPRSTYGKHTDTDHGDAVRVWGATDGTKGTWDKLNSGDYLLFYVGDETYRYAARVRATEQNEALANTLWPDYDTTTTGGDDPNEPWRWIIYLDTPMTVEIEGAEISDFAGHQRNYIVRFMRLNDGGHKAIRRRFGGVEEYIKARTTEDGATKAETTASGSGNSSAESRIDQDEWVPDLRPPQRTEAQVSRIIRNTALVRSLKEAYDYRCQLCGDVRQRVSANPYAEGHHLHPLGASPPGPDTKANIVILCPNHHVDFDYGQVRVDPVTLEISHAYESAVDGTTFTLQDDHQLAGRFLEYHNQRIASF